MKVTLDIDDGHITISEMREVVDHDAASTLAEIILKGARQAVGGGRDDKRVREIVREELQRAARRANRG